MPRAENREKFFLLCAGGRKGYEVLDKLSAARPKWARRRVLQIQIRRRIPSP